MKIIARRYDSLEPQAVAIEIAKGRIERVGVLDVPEKTQEFADLPFIAPGLFDAQVNGLKGQEFSSLDLTPERVASIARDQYAFGVTRFCPTLTTQSYEVLSHGLRSIAAACEESPEVNRMVAGVHVEGPFISKEDGPRGAHPLAHCRPPDWDGFRRLQEAANGRIGLLTLSPEYAEAPEFIRKAVKEGVTVAIGHTGADSSQIQEAVDAGARLSTHLGNGAHRTLRRHPNYLWDQLAEDRLTASLIVDGHHLPPAVVKAMVRAKTPARCILVSDVSGLAGLPQGRYPSSGGELEILADGRLVIAGQDQLLAGASRPIGAGIVNVMRFAGVSLAEAVDMASLLPARLLGKPAKWLEPGSPADFVLFRLPPRSETGAAAGLDVVATVAAGEVAYGRVGI